MAQNLAKNPPHGGAFCPRCGTETEQTCMSMLGRERDENKASCGRCGWQGYVYQCVKRPMALVKCPDGGILREIFKDREWGQLGMRTILPGRAKPGHVHHRRDEMWVLARGEDVWITAGNDKVGPNTFLLSPWYSIHMPAGIGHSVDNRGDEEAVILFWSSEVYDPEDPDTEPWEPA